MSEILGIGLVALVILAAVGGFIMFWFWSMRRAVASEMAIKEQELIDCREQLEAKKYSDLRILGYEAFGNIYEVSIDKEGRLNSMSSKLALTITDKEESLLGENIKSLFKAEEGENLLNSLSTLSEQADPEKPYELSLISKTSERKSYEVYALPSKEDVAKPETLHFLFKDVSSNKEVESKLSSRDKELSDFLYRSTHDLRGPLSSVLGLANVAKVDIQDQKALYYFDLVIDRVKRLDQILKDLLNLSDKESGFRNLNIINFAALVEDAARTIEHIDGYHDDSIVLSLSHNNKLIADNNLMLTIFKRVLDNAVKHRKRDGTRLKILINTSDFDRGVKVEVEDNGLGMDEELKQKIFDMFYRGNESEDGTGLGLYLVYKALEKMKSKVEIESAQGEGSKFIFFFQSQKEQLSV